MNDDLIAMARAAQQDDRLADGALLGKLADRLSILEAERADCEPYLKENETPAQRIHREWRDCQSVLKMLAADRTRRDAAEARVKVLEDALRGVIRVADRKTDEFDAARAALKGDTP